MDFNEHNRLQPSYLKILISARIYWALGKALIYRPIGSTLKESFSPSLAAEIKNKWYDLTSFSVVLGKVMNFNRIVCFDLEMCCWNDGRDPKTGEIIEIGLAELDLDTGEIVRRTQHYVKPEHDEISEFCTELTGIKPQVIHKNGKPLAEILRSIESKFGGKHKIYGAWGHDDRILQAECAAKGLKVPFTEYLNLAMIFRLQRHVKKKRCGQRAAMDIAGLEWEGRQHSGYDDAYNLARLTRTLFCDSDTQEKHK